MTWNAADPSAPGVGTTVATDDLGTAQVDINNVVGAPQTVTTLSYGVPVLGQGTGNGASFTVAADTTAQLKVDLTVGGLLTVLPNTTLYLQKFVDGAWATQQTLTSSPASHTFSGLTEGTWRVSGLSGGLSVFGTVNIAQTVTPTYLTQFEVGAMTNATGSVFADSLSGADVRSPLTVLSLLVGAAYVIPGPTGATVNGEHGSLTLFANGSYIYTPHAGLTLTEIGQVDQFTYKLTDPNGQEDTATLYVRIDTPDRDLVWDDTNPGAPATEGPALAALSVEEPAAVTDEDAATDGSGDHSDPSVVADTDFAHVASDAGTEGLLWEGSDAAINLTDLIGKVSGIDSIDLNNVSAVDLTLSLEDLVSITGPEADRLVIQGDDQDSVHLTGNWSSGVSQVENGLEYVIYTSPEDQTHQLWVQSGITVV